MQRHGLVDGGLALLDREVAAGDEQLIEADLEMRHVARPRRQILGRDLDPHLVVAGGPIEREPEVVAKPGSARVGLPNGAARIVAADGEIVVLVAIGKHLRRGLRLLSVNHRHA